MSYAQLDAARIAKAAKLSLQTLNAEKEKNETHQRKTLMIERIEALAKAASESKDSQLITMTAEEFWMLSQNW